MSALWLLIHACCHLFVLTSGATVSVFGSGAMSSPHPPKMRTEPEVHVTIPDRMPDTPHSSFTMNVTIVDARDTDVHPHSMLAIKDKNATSSVNVVSSWILFHMPGNHTEALRQPTLPKLVGGLRDAVADALEICRSSLGIVDMRAINIDVIDKESDYEEESKDYNGDSTSKDSADDDSGTLLEHAAKLMRRIGTGDVDRAHVNVTQIKAVYEVRIFPEMRTSDSEVGRRIDKFQIYSKFSDLNRLLSRSLSRVSDGHTMDDVMLDDVGYASRHQLTRPPLSADDLADCAEEVSLHDARQIHQFIVALSLLMVALITCAGSTVFTIKHASSVPSRMNPLVNPDN